MILMNDFKGEPPGMREAMLVAARRVLESGWYVLGNEVLAFEKQWAAACGVGNGMDAIEIVLRTLDIGPGDEVITTPMTAFSTVLAILRGPQGLRNSERHAAICLSLPCHPQMTDNDIEAVIVAANSFQGA